MLRRSLRQTVNRLARTNSAAASWTVQRSVQRSVSTKKTLNVGSTGRSFSAAPAASKPDVSKFFKPVEGKAGLESICISAS